MGSPMIKKKSQENKSDELSHHVELSILHLSSPVSNLSSSRKRQAEVGMRRGRSAGVNKMVEQRASGVRI